MNSKLHAVCDGEGRPIMMMLTEGQMSDHQGAFLLFDALPNAKELLGDKGYDDKMGARPLGRVIQEHIKKPLAEELLFGKLMKGGIVRVALKDDAIDAKMKALRSVGVPYTDAEIDGAKKAIEGKTELDALVAYLQGMGTALKQTR